jgi:excisionase family DNA binding protein
MSKIDLNELAHAVAALIDPPTPPLMTADEAATLLSVPASWVRSETRAGRMPGAVHLGKYWRYRRDDVLGWVERRSQGARP